MGPPGVGKSTQAARLKDRLGLLHISTGDVLRWHIAERSPLGLAAHAYMHRGELVPDELVTQMTLSHVLSPDGAHGVLLDGFPGTTGQAHALDAALATRGRAIDAVFYLTAPAEMLIQRLAGRRICLDCRATYHLETMPARVSDVCDGCGERLLPRNDDSRHTAWRRLTAHPGQTRPLVDRYTHAGVLHRIDGRGAAAEVTARLLTALHATGLGESGKEVRRATG